jgi:hypothetical protein
MLGSLPDSLARGEMPAFFIARDKPHALVWIKYRVFVGL